MKIRIDKASFDLKAPFVITGHVFHQTDTVRVTLEKDGVTGQGEGVGVFYLDETVDSMIEQLESVAGKIERAGGQEIIQSLLPAGGARNAIDCAFWDYRAKYTGKSIWNLLGMTARRLTTFFTIGIAKPEEMAACAAQARDLPRLKIKLDADRPVEKVETIRATRPDASLIVDANQGWTFDELKTYAPALAKLGVEMIEQPLPREGDDALDGYKSPIPLGADESCLHTGEFEAAAARYDVINIKLDKTGGLTEALKLADAARKAGRDLMIGNMTGTSLSMAPSFVIGQLCKFVDIDGPLLLKTDVKHAMKFGKDGFVSPPDRALWG